MALVRISTTEIQTWLGRDRIDVTTTEPADLDQLELFHWNNVSGRLAQRFIVSSWVDSATTPSLVRQIVSMLVAASVYRRYYSEDLSTVDNSWANWLEKQTECLVADLIAGSIILPEESGVVSSASGLSEIAFYPTDISSAADEAPYFSMGKVF